MQVNVLWTGREYYSLENCLIHVADTGVHVNSVIVGKYEDKLYRVEYEVVMNQFWQTTFFEVKSRHSNIMQHFRFEGDGKGTWRCDGKIASQFEGCIDIDIPLTPFTNTLPIKRLKMGKGSANEIKVIYVDLLEQQIIPVRQKYVSLSESVYHYENIPNDFEADIIVDEYGLVVDYPLLFERTSILHTQY